MAYSMTVEDIAHKLGGAKPAGDGSWYCRCPTHDDKKPSLWIAQRDGGGLNVRCHAGCAQENVAHRLRSMNLWPETGGRKHAKSDEEKRHRNNDEIAEILTTIPDKAPPLDWEQFHRPPPTVLYEYINTGGDLTSFVARWDNLTEGKEIRPVSLARRKSGRLDWVMKAPPGPYDLYHVDELALRPDAPVLIVEGEKAADAAAKLFPDHVCVTWRSGASSALKSDFTPLAGRHVTLWADADDAGIKAMEEVTIILEGVKVAETRVVALPSGLPKGWDLADPAPAEFDIQTALSGAVPVTESPASDTDNPETRLSTFIISASDLLKMDLPPREWLIERLISTSSLTMVFSMRGLGKTWFGLSLAISIVSGENFLDYEVEKPWRVLYVDGEMSLVDLQGRIRAIEPEISHDFLLLPSERLFKEAKPLNLHEDEDQAAIFGAIADLTAKDKRPDLIIFDNLSSLSGGIDENDNSALDGLLRWLVKLKHEGFAILLVHHAGKSGAQRGASRREDLLDTSIALLPPKDDDDCEPHDGAHFFLTFPKTRGPTPKPQILEMRLTEHQDRLVWLYNEPHTADRKLEILRMIWEHNPKTQKELCEIANLSAGAISGHCKKLRKANFLEPDGLGLTVLGRDELIVVFPDVEHKMLKQGEMFTGREI